MDDCPACARPFTEHLGVIQLCKIINTMRATLHNIASLAELPENPHAVLRLIEHLAAEVLQRASTESSGSLLASNVRTKMETRDSTTNVIPLTVHDAPNIMGLAMRHKHSREQQIVTRVDDLGINAMPFDFWAENWTFADGSPVGVYDIEDDEHER
ncbi:MAG: hypothetical protein E6Q97_16200 [Desulfurellales bacterium]|nr:MAG: hypothetical protein E6Q97_16200 [Desulfurellales bacterium]